MHSLLPLLLLAASQPAPDEIDVREAWENLQTSVGILYGGQHKGKESYDQFWREAEPKVLASRTKEEFCARVQEMFSRFGDSHFLIWHSDEQFYYGALDVADGKAEDELMPHIGAMFKPADGGWEVDWIFSDLSELVFPEDGDIYEVASPLRRGDVVESVNGEPFHPIKSLRPLVGQNAKYVIRRGHERIEAEIKCHEDPFLAAMVKGCHYDYHEHEGKTYMRLQVASMFPEAAEMTAAMLGQGLLEREVDGVILDLRFGLGGWPEKFIQMFTTPRLLLEGDIEGERLPLQLTGYDGPLVALIGPESLSAKEYVAHYLQQSKRAKLIGQATPGWGYGSPCVRITDWCAIMVPSTKVYLNGWTAEGNSVVPDVTAPIGTGADGSDLGIQAAIRELSRRQ